FGPGASAPFKGQLRDLKGPLQLAATITVNADLGWQLDGTASLRAGSPPALARALDQLGGADINGQRRISIAGTFD
ncbi:MAG TPA: type II secretion system protein N, partial [Steroidobacteraceae bacterium]|nr:type II secretion system protein N [Steroidobacteraceae bacterium]